MSVESISRSICLPNCTSLYKIDSSSFFLVAPTKQTRRLRQTLPMLQLVPGLKLRMKLLIQSSLELLDSNRIEYYALNFIPLTSFMLFVVCVMNTGLLKYNDN
jgi:hypothetical protein